MLPVKTMKLKTIKDNTSYKKAELAEISGLTGKIADKTLEQLEQEGIFVFPDLVKDAYDITQDQMILQSVNDTFRSGNVMGFVGYGDERLTIRSRFSENENDWFFQYLLEKALAFPNFVELNTDADQEDDRLFSFFIALFPRYLKAALRKGSYKQYVRNEYNDENVRGTIDVDRHIEKNIPFVGNIAYHQREFSFDNLLMELVRHTVEVIKKRPYERRLLGNVRDEIGLVAAATPGYALHDRQKIIDANKKNTVRHAYFREYRALQRLCLLILQHRKHRIGTGNRQIYGVLVDGAWLWEEYVHSLIGNLFYHPMNKGKSGAQRLFSGGYGEVYPDFISKNKAETVIADAKYKPMGNIGGKDYLQVLAYMFRFDAKKGFYLYPDAEENDSLTLWLNRGTTFDGNVSERDDICVVKHGLKIPKGSIDYRDFSLYLEESEKGFVSFFSTPNQTNTAE